MNKFEQQEIDKRNAKYRLDHFEVERNVKPSYDVTAPLPDAKHHTAYLKKVHDTYQMDGLHLDGALGRRMERTLDDAMREQNNFDGRGMTLCHASIPYKGKVTRLFYEVG